MDAPEEQGSVGGASQSGMSKGIDFTVGKDGLASPLPQSVMDLVTWGVHGAEMVLAEKPAQELMPVLLAGKKIIGFPQFDLETKHQLPRIKAELLKEHEAVVFVTEAWVSRVDPKTEPERCAAIDRGEITPPRLDPKRQEAVLVKLTLQAGRRVLWQNGLTATRSLEGWKLIFDSETPGVKFKEMMFE